LVILKEKRKINIKKCRGEKEPPVAINGDSPLDKGANIRPQN